MKVFKLRVSDSVQGSNKTLSNLSQTMYLYKR